MALTVVLSICSPDRQGLTSSTDALPLAYNPFVWPALKQDL